MIRLLQELLGSKSTIVLPCRKVPSLTPQLTCQPIKLTYNSSTIISRPGNEQMLGT